MSDIESLTRQALDDIAAAASPDALEALLVATAGWERDVTVDLSGHAEGRNIVAKVLPIQPAGEVSLKGVTATMQVYTLPQTEV